MSILPFFQNKRKSSPVLKPEGFCCFRGVMHPEKDPAVEHTAGPEECGLFVAGEVGDAVKALLQVGVGGDAVGHLAVVEQWVRVNEKHPETYVSRFYFLVGAGGLREPRI